MSVGPILVVDDEEDLLELIGLTLRREGFTTVEAPTGTAALELATTARPALVILDVMLPDLSGFEVCRRLRADEATRDVPIIMLSAKGEEIDRVVGFEVGADDYVVKSSFSVRELVLRVRAVLRRRGSALAEESTTTSREVIGIMSVDREAHQLFIHDEEVPLTVTEFRLLTLLADREGRVQTRGRLLQDVWDMPPDLNTRTVDTHIKRLREKLGAAAVHIETVRGVGYRFTSKPSAL